MSGQQFPHVTKISLSCPETAPCNVLCKQREPECDLLLLDPAIEISPEAIAEMQAVLHLHERHAIVTPWSGENGLEPAAARAIWERLSPLLPRYQVKPSAHGCLLIKAEVLQKVGLFDEAFVSLPGAIEDFVCRVNRRGYSALCANRAFVFQLQNAKLSQADCDLLLHRYPEYESKSDFYKNFVSDAVEDFAILFKPHRPRVLYDLSHLTGSYTGTANFGLNLLRELSPLLAGEADLFVGAHLCERFFLNELAGYRTYDERTTPDQVFDLAFKPCQFFSWTDFRRLDRLAPRLSFTLLDIIGVRCDYLNSPARQFVLQHAAELADCVFTLSKFVASDFSAFFGEELPFRAIHLGTDSGMTPDEFLPGEHVLVMGNEYAHKGIQEAVRYLNIDYPIVVLGGEPQPCSANVRWYPSGIISRQQMRDLFSRARVFIYPSFYEGFGLPVIDALALGKPVIVLDSALSREIQSTLGDPNLYPIPTLEALPAMLARLLAAEPAPRNEPRRWSEVAAEYAKAFWDLLSRDFDPAKMRRRRALLRSVAASD